MSDPIVDPDDLATYLGTDLANEARAVMILASAQTLCEAVVSPLPAGASAVVLDVAARAWTNPTNVAQQTAGPYATGYGPVGGGLWLTRQNKATLRHLAGGGGAFTVDMTPAGAGQNLPPWDTGAGGLPGDWDVPA